LFVATREKEILGYACYNATAPDFFGPTRVLDGEQGKQIGKALLLRSLHALQDEGYAYAIIGGVGPRQFYEKCVGATLIEGSKPGIYKDFLGARS
jgi:predicted N-acetyltransferase YhbS